MKQTSRSARLKSILDIDKLLIFALLAVTVNQLGHHLAQFQDPELWWIGYFQAIGIDLTIWRCSHWYKVYRGKKQRRYALAGLIFFLVVSGWFNYEYYASRPGKMETEKAIAMGAVLPLSVAAVSYLQGVKEGSAFSTAIESETEQPRSEPKPEGGSLVCPKCDRAFPWPSEYANRRAAQNAMNAHKCNSNGHLYVAETTAAARLEV